MFERFTDRARHVMVLAHGEARLLNHNFIGTEHLLLGLINEGEGVAAKVLGSLGISLEAARQRVDEIIGPASTVGTGSPPFTPRAKKVLDLALREALQLRHKYIGTEHMLLGLVREGEGVAAQVLNELGADAARVRETVLELLGEGAIVDDEPGPQPEPPLCHWCRAPLTQMTGYRVVEAAGPEGSEPMRVVVAFCRQCDRAVGVVGLAGDDGSGSGREDA